jgi:hypothetical protein
MSGIAGWMRVVWLLTVPAGGFRKQLGISEEWAMNSCNRVRVVLPKWFVLLAVLTVASAGFAQNKKTSAPAPAAHAAPKAAAPAQHGNTNAARPGAGGANNRPGAQTSRPGGTSSTNRPGGTNTSRPGGANAANRPGGTNTNRPGAQTSRPGGTNANNRPGGNTNASRPGGASANNRPGGNNGRAGGNNAAAANHHQPAGSKTVAMKGGGSATFRSNGQVRTIQSHGMTINHGMHGGRNISSMHNGRTIVSHGRYGGYSQRAYFNRGGHAYYQRTYFRGGHYYAYGYRGYGWGGRNYYGYAPPYYFGAGYYGWAYNPWAAPVAYGWGWGGSPWFGFYGPYFAPYPVYAGPAFWLTDYLIAANLQAAYAAQQAAGADNGGDNGNGALQPFGVQSDDEIASLWSTDPLIAANLQTVYGAYMLGGGAPAATTGLSPEVKQALSDEMKYEIGAEKAAAAAGSNAAAPSGDQVPPALDPKIRIFVVSSDEDLTTSDGTECGLTAGDVIYRTTDTPDGDNMVNATVKSSKKDECALGATVGVSADDLQEMHNQLRIQMDAGLKELADKQGKNGIPAAPDTKTQPGEVPAPTPDTSVQGDLQQQAKDADAAEAEAKQQ